jgi:hypothetical protein
MTRHTIAKIFASESHGSNITAGAAWQRSARVDIPNRMTGLLLGIVSTKKQCH